MLYVLLVDTREQKTDFNYWLNTVEQLGGESPLFVVMNEKHEHSWEIDSLGYRKRFNFYKKTFSLDLSEKENRGLHREIENKYDIRCGTPFLVDGSNGNNICGQANEETIKKWADGKKIPKPPEQPKPKSTPPPLPRDFDDEEQINKFKESYNKWKEENKHLPNLQTVETIIERFKSQAEDKKNPNNRIDIIEQKLDRLMNHLGVK